MKKYIITALIALFLNGSVVFASTGFEKNLYFGLQGSADVSKLQEFLTSEGVYAGPITGNFFSLTLKGVKEFQVKYGIEPAAGYFGILTRTKANDILAGQLLGSDSEQISELGVIATTTAPKTIDDQVNALLQQISLLQQQLTAQQSTQQTMESLENRVIEQTQTIQDQQQTLTQIQQNTQQQQETLTQIQQNRVPTSTPVVQVPEPVIAPKELVALKLLYGQEYFTENPIRPIFNPLAHAYIAVGMKQGDNYLTTNQGFIPIEVSTPDPSQNKTGNEFGVGDKIEKCWINPAASAGSNKTPYCPKIDGKKYDNLVISIYHFVATTPGTYPITFYAPSLNSSTSIVIIAE